MVCERNCHWVKGYQIARLCAGIAALHHVPSGHRKRAQSLAGSIEIKLTVSGTQVKGEALPLQAAVKFIHHQMHRRRAGVQGIVIIVQRQRSPPPPLKGLRVVKRCPRLEQSHRPIPFRHKPILVRRHPVWKVRVPRAHRSEEHK